MKLLLASAPVRRASRRQIVASLLEDAMGRHGFSDAQMARVTGAKRQKVSQWRDQGDTCSVQLTDVPVMGRVGLDLVRWLASEMELRVLPIVAPGRAENVLAGAASVAKEAGEAVASIVAGASTHGGHFTDEELASADRELHELETATAILRANIERMKRERAQEAEH